MESKWSQKKSLVAMTSNGCYGSHWLIWKFNCCCEKSLVTLEVNDKHGTSLGALEITGYYGKSLVGMEEYCKYGKSMVAMKSQW
jgi:hypothetical protein